MNEIKHSSEKKSIFSKNSFIFSNFRCLNLLGIFLSQKLSLELNPKASTTSKRPSWFKTWSGYTWPILLQLISAGNIVEVLQADERFSTLVAAVVKAELVEALSGGKPFFSNDRGECTHLTEIIIIWLTYHRLFNLVRVRFFRLNFQNALAFLTTLNLKN